MKEGICHIHLMNGPVVRHGNGEKNPDRRHFGHRAKRVMIVYAILLAVSLSHEPCFVSGNGAVRVFFSFICPSASEDVGIGRGRDKLPGALLLQGEEFSCHG